MKKKILLILLILALFTSIGIIYLNSVVLPTKIKSLIINFLQEETQKKVSLQALQFHIFKGLVLKNLTISDDKTTIVSLKEGSCTFLILPVFKKMIIIPTVRLKSPEIFLKRQKDNTFNIQDLFFKKVASTEKPTKFSIFVYKVKLTDGSIKFQDDTLTPAFTKNLENLNLNLYLSLPASVKFNLSATIPGGKPGININTAGEFSIPQQQLTAKISIQNLAAKEFLAYYQDFGINVTEGLLDSLIDLKLKERILYVEMTAQSKNLSISKDKIQILVNSDIKTNLQYALENKQLALSGKARVSHSQVTGLEFVGNIDDISGEVAFNDSGLTADGLSANIWDMPIVARVNLTDFNQPLLNINITSSLNLVSAQGMLKDKFKFVFPGDIRGEGNLSLGLQTKIPFGGPLQIKGSLDISNAILRLKNIDSPLDEINGRLEFSPNQIKWPGINFKYLGIPYKTVGVLTNFQSPGVQLELTSSDLSLASTFAINNKLVKLAKLTGRYLNSDFSLTGNINTANLPNLESDISGNLDINLGDIKVPLKKFKDQLGQINPQGLVNVQFNLNGNINDLKSCAVQAKLAGPSISAYGLKAQEFSLDYSQAAGLVDIPLMHLSLYDGTIQASAKMNLNSENLPYWVNADIKGVKIEKLKSDTAAKEEDIAGTVTSQIKINGFSGDISRLSGAGEIFISEGRLWQLNLFRGLGALLFARDFASIIFQEGYCGFSVQDKYIFTDNLKLKSNIASLSGSVKIGFDRSIDAALNVEVLDEMVPLSGTFKDVATAIIGRAGRFGVIKISGTLKEPKYKFRPAVVDIMKSLKDALFGNDH